MPRKLLISPQATRDLDTAALVLAHDTPERGDALLDAALATCHRLAEMPYLGSGYPFESRRLRDLRRWFVPDFPGYVIFYRATDDALLIVRVLPRTQNLGQAFDDLAPDDEA